MDYRENYYDDYEDDPEIYEEDLEFDDFETYYAPAPAPPAPAGITLTVPGPGCITIATLLVCAGLAIFLLKVASGIAGPSTGRAIAVAAAEALQAAPPAADPALAANSEAANAACQVSNLFPEKVLRWCGLISHYASTHNLSPDLVAALIWQESGGNETAFSRSGAVGLMQVMPSDGPSASFMCVNGPCFSDRPTTAELQDPEFNIAWGTRYLAGLLNRKGDLREALKSYGPMNVGYYYADIVLGLFERYKTPTPAAP